MKKKFQGTDRTPSPVAKHIKHVAGPSLYEVEYLNQVVEELKIFLQSKNVTTVKDIYLGFQGGGYQGKLLLSKGA
jgi:hypothetical protein